MCAAERPPLLIPSLLAPDAENNITLTLQTGSMPWRASIETTTWGINGGFLGPALEIKRDQTVHIHTLNHLPPAEHAYMAHCHLLEHEDTGMMMSFTVAVITRQTLAGINRQGAVAARPPVISRCRWCFCQRENIVRRRHCFGDFLALLFHRNPVFLLLHTGLQRV